MLDFKDIGKNIVFGASRKMSDMRGSRKFSYIYIFLTRNNINNTKRAIFGLSAKNHLNDISLAGR